MLLNKAFKPFGIFEMAVRNNCPWHRSNFRPVYFPMKVNRKLKVGSVEARMKTVGGRQIIMRRVLQEKPFLGWGHDPREPVTKLSYPL